ncbi:MAG TPA: class I tRNA ligase family protein [Nitrospira sp.]|nr:class I tRNA ligase family protein [Nitrospira sp.]
MYLDGPRISKPVTERTFADRWILSRLNSTIRTVASELDAYRFDRAASALYHFIWHEYCDWYLELIKPALQNSAHPDGPTTRQTLVESLETTMRLLHPFMPFITEEIWQTIPHEGESIVIQRYPIPNDAWDAPDAEQRFVLLEQAVSLVRTGRVLLNYPPGQQVEYGVAHDDPATQEQLRRLEAHLAHLSRGTPAIAGQSAWPQAQRLRLVSEGLTIGLAVSGEVDLKKALDRLVKQREEQEKDIARLTGKLDNQEFVAKAPAEVLTEHRTRLRRLQHDQAMLASSEQQLRALLGA